jgi:aspartokinase-like uncharacterized kinase
MTEPGLTVLKLGGSLLAMPDLAGRLRSLMDILDDPTLVMIVGGGRAADAVRFFDHHASLDATVGHWLAIRAMQFNTHLVQALLRDSEIVESLDTAVRVGSSSRVVMVDPLTWLTEAEQAGQGVPHQWSFTSDAIAATAACRLQAKRLLVLKSTDAPPGMTRQQAADGELVDPCFPQAAADLPRVELMNLRRDEPEPVTLR